MDDRLTIRQAAARTGLGVHALRYYERVGLLDPVGRTSSGQRRYGSAELAWIAFLNRLRRTGMPISRMQEFAELRRGGRATVPQRLALLERHRTEVEDRMATLQRGLDALSAKIEHYRSIEPDTAAGKGARHDA